jgi:hypothetical protein
MVFGMLSRSSLAGEGQTQQFKRRTAFIFYQFSFVPSSFEYFVSYED